jgi:hypothetical protein
MAPECFAWRSSIMTNAVDVYSFGVLLVRQLSTPRAAYPLRRVP